MAGWISPAAMRANVGTDALKVTLGSSATPGSARARSPLRCADPVAARSLRGRSVQLVSSYWMSPVNPFACSGTNDALHRLEDDPQSRRGADRALELCVAAPTHEPAKADSPEVLQRACASAARRLARRLRPAACRLGSPASAGRPPAPPRRRAPAAARPSARSDRRGRRPGPARAGRAPARRPPPAVRAWPPRAPRAPRRSAARPRVPNSSIDSQMCSCRFRPACITKMTWSTPGALVALDQVGDLRRRARSRRAAIRAPAAGSSRRAARRRR